jgi:hypothetical protein
VLATSIRPPTVQEVRRLTLSDLAIAAGLADELRDRLREFVQIDPFTVTDPFDKDNYSYFVVVDREKPDRVVAMIVDKKDPVPQLLWVTTLDERLAKLPVSKEDAKELKHELMPKEEGNFYPYRRSGKVVGYLMFAFQICGQR